MGTIPSIDFHPFRTGNSGDRARVAAEIGAACRSIGFLCLTGHGVSATVIGEMRETLRDFFALPEAEKRSLSIGPGRYRGYIPLGTFSPNAGRGGPDLYEGYKLQRELAAGPIEGLASEFFATNPWPRRPAAFRATVLRYWSEIDRLRDQLLCAFAGALGLEEGVFLPAFASALDNMTLLHYPPVPLERLGYGIHPHKDSDAFTLLAPDPVGGLEVRTKDGGWIEAACPDEGFIVNIGDMMELWSGGRFLSTPHRVVNRSGRERYSFPFFATPGPEVIITPAVPAVAGFQRPPLDVGRLTAEVFRTNWRGARPRDPTLDLGTLSD